MNKNLFPLFLFLVIVACNKGTRDNLQTYNNSTSIDPVDTSVAKPVGDTFGVLQNYLSQHSGLTYRKTTDYPGTFIDTPTSRGFAFTPFKNMKITSIGGMISQKGVYKITITPTYYYVPGSSIDLDSLEITDTSKFTYKKLTVPLNLSANTKYNLVYFARNHNAVYDVSGTGLLFPTTTKDIRIEGFLYGYYANYQDAASYFEIGGSPYVRGLIDFKYALQ